MDVCAATRKKRSLPRDALKQIRRFTIELGHHAEMDLEHVAELYAERHPNGHDRFFRDVRSAFDVLATFPRAGRERDELRPNLRSYPVHPYLVFYRVDDAAYTVTIVRVLHGHMDLDPDELEGLA